VSPVHRSRRKHVLDIVVDDLEVRQALTTRGLSSSHSAGFASRFWPLSSSRGAVGQGLIGPDAATMLLQAIAAACKVVEFDEHERRLAALEKASQR